MIIVIDYYAIFNDVIVLKILLEVCLKMIVTKTLFMCLLPVKQTAQRCINTLFIFERTQDLL